MKIFKRKIYSEILKWKKESNGKTALLIEGPRRVGKSTIVKEFAQREYKTHIIIDFNKVSPDIKNLFNNLLDLDYIFLYLQTIFHVSLLQRESVIVFDEVQKCPMARQAIKYLVEDGRYDYIETGSLISIKKNTAGITIPSEEERISMHPMDFEEFEWALGNENLFEIIGNFWLNKKSVGPLHRSLMKEFRLYMLIGGMPQAVEEYIFSNDFKKVDDVKRRIIRLYEDDFIKLDPSGRISQLFLSIPSQLSNGSKRFSTFAVIGKQTEEALMIQLQALEESKTVNVCFQCNDPNVGMNLTKDLSSYKLFMADTGLFISLAFWDKDFTENTIYQKLLMDKLPANLGYIFENMIAQMIVAKGNNLYYYSWKKDDRHYYEIDFILPRGVKIDPIEVKSSTSATAHSSLDAFINKFSNRIGNAFLVIPKEFSKEQQVTILPPYFFPFI